MTNRALLPALILIPLIGLAGCKSNSTSSDANSSQPAGAPSDNSATAGNGGSPSNASEPSTRTGGSSSSAASSLFEAKPFVVKPGTEIVVVADQSVSSKDNNAGDHFDASVAQPVVVGDRVVIPKGARASGTVVDAKSAGRFKGNAELTVALDTVTVKGREYRVKTTHVTESGKGRGKRTAEGAGGGAVVGALVGALAGRGKGAAIGAAAGAGAGTAGAAMTGERDITINPESKLSFKLENALEIERK